MTTFVFDVNETLSDMAPLGEALVRHGAPAELARTWFAAVLRDGFALSLHRQAPAFADLGRQVLARLLAAEDLPGGSVGAAVDDVMATLQQLDVHPDVRVGIPALHGTGHRLVAFSNGAASSTTGLLERSGLLEHVDRVLSVEDLDVWKPHPDAYAHAARSLGADAGALTLVAVHPWDIDGAARAGFVTAYVDRVGAPWPAVFRRPDRVVPTIVALG